MGRELGDHRGLLRQTVDHRPGLRRPSCTHEGDIEPCLRKALDPLPAETCGQRHATAGQASRKARITPGTAGWKAALGATAAWLRVDASPHASRHRSFGREGQVRNEQGTSLDIPAPAGEGLDLSPCAAGPGRSCPARVVRIGAGFPRGGPLDVVMRTVAPALEAGVGVAARVEYQIGANCSDAARLVDRAAPVPADCNPCCDTDIGYRSNCAPGVLGEALRGGGIVGADRCRRPGMP